MEELIPGFAAIVGLSVVSVAVKVIEKKIAWFMGHHQIRQQSPLIVTNDKPTRMLNLGVLR